MSKRGEPIFRRCTKCNKRKSDNGACQNCGHRKHTWTFVVDVAAKGAPRRQVMRGGFPTKAAASAAMQDELVDRRRGAHVERSSMTFGEYATGWIEGTAKHRVTLGSLQETTYAIYERDLRNHLMPALRDVPLQQLGPADLTRHYANLRATLGAKTIGNVHGLAHLILESAVDDEAILRNPADRAVKPKSEDSDEQPTWSPEQVVAFLAHVHDNDPNWHALYSVIAATGIRRGEAIGATWAAVDLDAGTLEVRQTITKAGSKVVVKAPKSRRSRRTVPLPPAVVAILRLHRARQNEVRLALGAQWQDDDLVFPGDDGRYRYPDYVSTKFSTYAKRCGLPPIGGPHGLRHSLASSLDASGKGLATISALLGHASTAVTSKVYVHMIEGQDRTAVDEHASALFPEAL